MWLALQDCHPYGLYLASSDACLAICLAYERNRGQRSPFYPYISSLTNETPGFFSKDAAKVKQLLRQMGECYPAILYDRGKAKLRGGQSLLVADEEARELNDDLSAGVQSRDAQKFLNVVNKEREIMLVFAKFAVKTLSLGKLLGVTVNDVMWCLSHVSVVLFFPNLVSCYHLCLMDAFQIRQSNLQGNKRN